MFILSFIVSIIMFFLLFEHSKIDFFSGKIKAILKIKHPHKVLLSFREREKKKNGFISHVYIECAYNTRFEHTNTEQVC